MPRTRTPYSAEFRQQIIELARAGRTPKELAEEFEPCADTIRDWIAQADRDDGRRSDGLTSAERDELTRLRREVRRLRQERDILSKGCGLVRSGDEWCVQKGFQFVSANQARFPVSALCHLMGVSTSGYYAWAKGTPSQRSMVDVALTRKIRTIHLQSKKTYGAPRIHAELADNHNIHVGRKRVARLMRRAKIKGASHRVNIP